MKPEEIDKIASAFAIDEVKDTCNPASKRGLLYVGFITGAKWADAHPHWISVEDELPKDGEYVATINTVGVKDVRYYYHGKWYSNFGNEYGYITHWMPLPKMPVLSNSEKTGKDLKGGEE